MAKQNHLLLNPAQKDSLEEFVQELALHVVDHKRSEPCEVFSMVWLPKQMFVTGLAREPKAVPTETLSDQKKSSVVTKIYKPSLHLPDSGFCHSECTCEKGADCEHAVALAMHLLKLGGTKANPGKGTAKPEAVAESKALPQDSMTHEPTNEPLDKNLVRFVEGQLGRSVKTSVRTLLQQASQWWKANLNKVPINTLRQATGYYYLGQWGGEQLLYPREKPPQNGREYLTYLSAALEQLNAQLPAPLPDFVDKELHEHLVGDLRKLRQIEEWRTSLRSWSADDQGAGLDENTLPQFRLRMTASGASIEFRTASDPIYKKAKASYLKEFTESAQVQLNVGSSLVLDAAKGDYGLLVVNLSSKSPNFAKQLHHLVGLPHLRDDYLVGENGQSLVIHQAPLNWRIREPSDTEDDYEFRLLTAEGETVAPPVVVTNGVPRYYFTAKEVWPIAAWPFKDKVPNFPLRVPAAAVESTDGIAAFQKLRLPAPSRVTKKLRLLRPKVEVQCQLHREVDQKSEQFMLTANASYDDYELPSVWMGAVWTTNNAYRATLKPQDGLTSVDRSVLPKIGNWLRRLPLKSIWQSGAPWHAMRTNKDFPEEFISWFNSRPQSDDLILRLDPELASLCDGAVSGSVCLDVQPAEDGGMDWFDLKVDLSVSDVTLSKEEIDLLLKAKGKWVRIAGKGWRKIEFQLTEEQQRELADMGLAASDFDGEKQRLHALQLAGKGKNLIPESSALVVSRRAEEIQTSIAPALPASITATLRPYQISGFNFLAYLSANRFGGVLADDMGLGKTLQTLCWIAWLRETQQIDKPVLVICPKSVQDNWRNEAMRFLPGLKVTVWTRDDAGRSGLKDDTDMLVVHYQQLRLHEDAILGKSWGVSILDEAQAIKNPSSQTAQAVSKLRSTHRLALTGTPIENRLLDLWSILNYAMPGALGTRSYFTKHFDSKTDPLARRRLAARVRPFLLRRTKNEVATDLPDRIEEDLSVELEGVQQKLYNAELKRARAQLLKAATSKELDKLRFNILTSLLRLRQICCHPQLVGNHDAKAESAKLNALLEQLEPLMEEGQKVLVFSQFVEMIDIMEVAMKEQGWPVFKLTGSTDNRGALVDQFSAHEGNAVFLISIKAGGFGINLTAASYVVIFDPWWNPAVEAQAIDRTHRIGQKQTVIAYRLIVKGSIEEKIRLLQKQKGALAQDILGEESFAQALTLNDFQFLLEDMP